MSTKRAGADTRPTVFFGPFIGEFGWEFLYWQGWIRRACRTTFAAHWRIASSVAGREAFYPDVDEYWPLPNDWKELVLSSHAYFLDGWRNGLPAARRRTRHWQAGILPRWRFDEVPLPEARGEQHAYELLDRFRARLPDDAYLIVPWRWNDISEEGLGFGVAITDAGGVPQFRFQKIPFDRQTFELLEATDRGKARWAELNPAQPLIALFPRYRTIRRADKNWAAEKYLSLIRGVRARHPDHAIAIVGEPGGVYFADGVPEGCIDLVNVPDDERLDIQLAALAGADLALGSMSGALLVALAAGCPTIMWGYEETRQRCHEENLLGSPFVFHSQIDPDVTTVLTLVSGMLDGRFPKQPQDAWNTLRDLGIGPVRSWYENRL